MILQDTINEIEQIGNISEQAEFSIKASKKAFSILSGLYSDIYLGIIREIGANAMDSHVAAGKRNVPIEIHLPNALEPWLTIRDFGTGISHKDIYSIYTKYFESTKTNTNEQTGCFGLGSKIFLAYTDNSTIYSIVDGVKRIYNVFFNASGVPSISLMSQENTTECNGLSVQIPIKSSDFEKFKDATYRACGFYDVKPNITGGKIDWNIEKAQFSGSFWQSYHNLQQSVALMGNVAYPIETYKLSYDHQDIARKAGLVVKFNLGELEITPSRESLAYTDFTIKALNEKIESVKADFVEKVEDTIKNSKDLLEAMKALFLLNNQWSFLNSKLVSGKVMWKGIDITDPRRSIQANAPELNSIRKNTWGRKKFSESSFPALDNNAMWYVDDLVKGGYKRVLNHLRFASDKIAINLVTKNGMENLVKVGFPASVFNKTSDLAQVAVAARKGSNSSRPTGKINLYDFGYEYQTSWESKSFDVATGVAPKYYVIKGAKNWDVVAGTLRDSNGNAIVTPTKKGTLRDVLQFLGIEIEDVKMVAQGNAKFLDQLGSKSIAEIINKKKISVDIEKVKMVKSIDTRNIRDIAKNKDFQKVSEDNSFKKMIMEWNNVIQDVEKIAPILKYIRVEERYELTFPSKMVEMMYHACGSWQVGIHRVMDALLEQEQNS